MPQELNEERHFSERSFFFAVQRPNALALSKLFEAEPYPTLRAHNYYLAAHN